MMVLKLVQNKFGGLRCIKVQVDEREGRSTGTDVEMASERRGRKGQYSEEFKQKVRLITYFCLLIINQSPKGPSKVRLLHVWKPAHHTLYIRGGCACPTDSCSLLASR